MDLEELCAKHREAIESAIRLTCARHGVFGADADDLGAELWLCVLEHDGRVLRRFQGRSAIGTYLFTVMDRKASKWIRQRVFRQCREHPVGDSQEKLGSCPDPNLDPEAALAEAELLRQRIRAVRQASAKLPSAEKAVFRLRWAGLAILAIAMKLGLTVASAEHHLYRAIHRMRGELSTSGAHQRNGQARRIDRLDGRTDGRTDGT